jgi:hypothetical protein
MAVSIAPAQPNGPAGRAEFALFTNPFVVVFCDACA